MDLHRDAEAAALALEVLVANAVPETISVTLGGVTNLGNPLK
ncbi:hypothetical protein WMF28_00960 [Sorangium sp. So ce590]